MRLAEVAGHDRALHRADDLAERDVRRGAGQHVAAADPPLGAHQAGAFEGQEDLLQVGLREAGALGDVADRGGLGLPGVQAPATSRARLA